MQEENNPELSPEEVDKCIHTLSTFLENTDLIYELSQEKRNELMTLAGKLSRPNKEEFERRKKDAKKAAKRKQAERDRHARKETGIRSAREALIFEAPNQLYIDESLPLYHCMQLEIQACFPLGQVHRVFYTFQFRISN